MFGQRSFFFQHMWPKNGRKEVASLLAHVSVYQCAVQYPFQVLWQSLLFGSTTATAWRSNACIIAQTMSNCFSFSIFQRCVFCVFCLRCLLVDCRRGSPFGPPFGIPYLFLNFSHCLHTFCTQCSRRWGSSGVRVYLLCKEASKRSPFFRQYEMGSHTIQAREFAIFPSKLVYKGRQTRVSTLPGHPRPFENCFSNQIENAF